MKQSFRNNFPTKLQFGWEKQSIDYESEDKQPVRLVFLLGTPLKAVGEFLKVLAKLSKLLREDKIRNQILKAETPHQIRKIFEDAED